MERTANMPLRRSLSRCWAIDTALGFVSMTELSNEFKRSDTPEITLHQILAAQLARSHGGLKLGNTFFNKIKTHVRLKQIVARVQ